MDTKRALLIAAGLLIRGGTHITTTTYAQTSGRERRGERRDNRDEGREEKAECKAGDEKTRAECREDKRDTKQEGRGNDEKAEQPTAPEGGEGN
jgi:hypothetical protein